jgi:hypothetical protein
MKKKEKNKERKKARKEGRKENKERKITFTCGLLYKSTLVPSWPVTS